VRPAPASPAVADAAPSPVSPPGRSPRVPRLPPAPVEPADRSPALPPEGCPDRWVSAVSPAPPAVPAGPALDPCPWPDSSELADGAGCGHRSGAGSPPPDDGDDWGAPDAPAEPEGSPVEPGLPGAPGLPCEPGLPGDPGLPVAPGLPPGLDGLDGLEELGGLGNCGIEDVDSLLVAHPASATTLAATIHNDDGLPNCIGSAPAPATTGG